MKKRLFAYLLALALCLSLLPAAALAAGTHGDHTGWTALSGDVTNLTLTDGNNYYLSGDVTVSDPITVEGTVTLCLNGHVLNLGGQYISVGSGATLTLCDCTSGTTQGYLDSSGLWNQGTPPEGATSCDLTGGVITGGRGYKPATSNYTYGGGVYVDNGGTFTMSGGNIAGNAGTYGGGVFVEYGSFQMTGGAITRNSATDGGGVCVTSDLSFTMSGTASITDNTASNRGGGVWTYSTFAMEGGAITDNRANMGGGVYVYRGTFNLSGAASITGNSATGYGGGVYMQNDSSFTMSGSPTITGNTLTDGITANANNVYLNNKKITIDGALSNTTSIGVTTGISGILTTEWSTYMDGKNPADYFFSDNAAYGVALTDGGEAILAEKSSCYAVTFAPNGGSGTMADQLFLNTSSTSQALFANAFTRPGYTFTGWNTKADGTGTPYEDGAELTLTEDITLYAQWAYIPPYIPPTAGSTAAAVTAVTAVTDGNGAVTVNPTSAKAGDTVTVTAVPKAGYEVGSITVTTVLGQNVPVTGNTFVMPGAAVTVQVTFVKAEEGGQPWANPFTDVPAGAWFYEDVAWACENGLMEGVGGSRFAPGSSVSRSMVWAVLARIDGQAVSGSSWAQDARAWAMAAGVSDGTMAGENVTREQLATMLYRFAQAKGWDVSVGESTNILSYADAGQISEWAVPAMQWACGAGILQGSDGSLNPGDSASRAELAAMLARFARL